MKIPWSPERIAEARAKMAPLAEAAGLEYGERSHWYDSTLAHEATEWARERGGEAAFRRAIFRAYFALNLNIGTTEVLVEMAAQLGLDAPDLGRSLQTRRYRERVAAQYQEARALGVRGVPTFIADRYAIVGLYPYENFRELMAALGQEPRRPTPDPQGLS